MNSIQAKSIASNSLCCSWKNSLLQNYHLLIIEKIISSRIIPISVKNLKNKIILVDMATKKNKLRYY